MSQNRPNERVTIVDVAREANVSFATVSRVVNGKGYVSAQTRERVMQAMTRIGYTVNRQARVLAGGRTQVVGLLVRDLDTSYIGEILKGIDEVLASESYDLMLYTTHHRRTRESVFVNSLANGMTDGLLMILPMAPEAYIDSIRRRGVPFVLIDHEGFDAHTPSVSAANREGARAAIQHLVDLGHTRIAVIAGNLEMDSARQRLAGCEVALQSAGLGLPAELLKLGDFHRPLAYQLTQELLRVPDPPTAIFAGNDVSAFGALDAVRNAGLQVPHDVSVVGFDDIPDATWALPPLTTVRQPMRDMGKTASRMLLNAITDPGSFGGKVELPADLVIRESTAPPQS
ncbi:MAG TPA: LacI family DNA-binding transcriptional regulator [Thermomicrobiales bacterium]|nr:LacI family DNA-binding transcriptional regulator [Thermomicrobiales bacterium]